MYTKLPTNARNHIPTRRLVSLNYLIVLLLCSISVLVALIFILQIRCFSQCEVPAIVPNNLEHLLWKYYLDSVDNGDAGRQQPTLPVVPAFKHFEVNLRTAKRKRIAGCLIEKNMSTVLVAIVCFLHDPEAFRNANRTLTGDDFYNRFCADKNEFNSYNKMLRNSSSDLEEWKLFAFVRDPLDRFVSSFTDKCVKNLMKYDKKHDCHGCKGNLTCFVQSVYDRSISYASGKRRSSNMEDMHTFPQNWHCEFSKHMDKIKIKKYYNEPERRKETFRNLAELLHEMGVELELIDEIIEDIFFHSTQHSTVSSPEHQKYFSEIVSDKKLLGLVYSIYYYDYVMFDFPFLYALN